MTTHVYQAIRILSAPTPLAKGRSHYQWGTLKKDFQVGPTGPKGHLFKRGERIGVRLSDDKKLYTLVSDQRGVVDTFTLPMTHQTKALLVGIAKWGEIERTLKVGHKKQTYPLVKVHSEVNLPGLAKWLEKMLHQAAVPRALSKDLEESTSAEEVLACIKNKLIYAESVTDQFSNHITGWYGLTGPRSIYSLEILRSFCRAAFKFISGEYELFRGTKLKGETLPVGYVFQLQTSKQKSLQSWSRDADTAISFAVTKESYLFRGRIPSNLLLATDVSWRQLGDLLRQGNISERFWAKLASRLLDSLSDKARSNLDATVGKKEARSQMASCLKDVLMRALYYGPYSHSKECEALVDFSSGFEPHCEVLFRVL